MKIKVVLLAGGALLVTLLLAAACGGDGDGTEAGIRTERGLSVAAIVAGQGGGEETDTGSETISTGAPPADTGIGVGAGGLIAPDIFPFPFPSLQQSQEGITVQGFGSASVQADSAVLEFYFSSFFDDIIPLPEPAPLPPETGQTEPGFEGSASGDSDIAEPEESGVREQVRQITEADLQPVVDAIVAQGVSRADMEVIVEPSFGDPYYGGSATIRVTVGDVNVVERVVNAATEAASGLEGIGFNGTNVSYAVSDCASLELAAMEAAVQDARERGRSFAGALGVGLGEVAGASHTSYSPFGSPCDAGSYGGPYPLTGVAYAESQTMEVQLIATVAVTFAIQ